MLGSNSVRGALLPLGAVWGALSLLACSAVVNPDPGRLGVGPGVDAGPDSGTVNRFDSGPLNDPCRVGPYCSGDNAIRCVNNTTSVESCTANNSVCFGGECIGGPPGCTPGTQYCSGDGNSVVICDALGNEVEESCGDSFCRDGECGDDPPERCGDVETIRPDTQVDFDLCDHDDDHSQVEGNGCEGARADTGERIFAIEIEEGGRYRIELEDRDGDVRIDTIVYLRNQCADENSQFACGSSTPCEGGGSCFDGINFERSRIVAELEPGIYYVVADGFERVRRGREWECGEVRLSVERERPPPG